MCDIRDGEEAVLLKNGLVRLKDGSIHNLKDCDLGAGGKLILSAGEYTPRSVKKKKKYVGKAHLDGAEIDFLGSQLQLSPIALLKTEKVIEQPPPPPPPKRDPYEIGVLSMVGATLMFVLKKVAGLDRKLREGSCAIRHQEAIIRIAKLEGKVLRKQIIDGAKTAKSIKDKVSEKKEGG